MFILEEFKIIIFNYKKIHNLKKILGKFTNVLEF